GAARQPARVVFDSGARLPVDSALVRSLDEAPLYVFCESGAEPARVAALRELGRLGITSLLVEGGAELAGSLLAAGEVDELCVFVAPKVLGAGVPLASGAGFERVADAIEPLAVEQERIGEDTLARARLREW